MSSYRSTFAAKPVTTPALVPGFGLTPQRPGSSGEVPAQLAGEDEGVVLWRVCWAGWDRKLRHDVASATLMERYGVKAAVIADAWLARTAAFEQSVQV